MELILGDSEIDRIARRVVELMRPEPAVKSTVNLLDARGAAEVLGVKSIWVQEAARLGKLPVVKVGKHNRFRQADLDKWILENRVRQSA